MFRKTDVESGEPSGGAMMNETPQLRWSFIRKVYSIITFQLLLTLAVASVVVFVHPIQHFFFDSTTGLVLFIVLLMLPFIQLCPLYCYRRKHPLNYFLLFIFTITVAFAVGLTCAFTGGKVILEALILTTVMVISLTIYTFWAARRGHDFSFIGPFLFGALLVLIAFGLIQILYPLGKLSVMIYGCMGSIIFCGCIIYDTDNLLKRYSYDDYIWASVSLYLGIINLFMSLLNVFSAAE